MRRLQRLRASASAISSSTSTSCGTKSFVSRTGRLQQDLHATPNRKLSTGNQTWLSTQRREFSCSSLRMKDEKTASTTAEDVPSNSAELKELDELLELQGLEDAQEVEIETDLPIPKGFTRAPLASEVTDPEYTPAQSGEGLEVIGGWTEFWDRPNAWPESKSYFGFKPFNKVTDPALLAVIVRRALIEALAVGETQSPETLAESWRIGGSAEDDLAHVSKTVSVKLTIAEDGTPQISGPLEDIVQNVLGDQESFWEGEMSAEEAQELAQNWDPSWKQASLADPRLKFAVMKRIQQLSGHVIPDAKQIIIHDVSALLGYLVRPPKAKKLAEELEMNDDLQSLPNVKVYGRRVTQIDKEKMVGRWKIITKELDRRGLPAIGSGGQGKNIEYKWGAGLV